MNRLSMLALLVIALGLGAGLGYWLATARQPAPEGPSAAAARQPLYYRSPMDPTVTSPVPAKDPMGMDYVPVYADEPEAPDTPPGTVSIDPVTRQNIGIRTAPAVRTSLSRVIRAVGRIDYDEERLARLHPKTEGWIEKLWVDKTGEQAGRNQILLSVYSPRLVAGQQEYLIALRNLEGLKESPYADIRQGAEALVETARARLELLDVPEHQIHELEHTGRFSKDLHIHSPFDGIVVAIGVRQGQYVTPQTELYKIADLSTVWVLADIYEYELPWVKVGDAVEMQLAGIPGKRFHGHLAYIYPYAESETRTVRVRLQFDNPQLLLRPAMFAEVVIRAEERTEALVIPAEAVVRSGAREQVFVVRGPGTFEPRLVRLGIASEGRVEVLEGLSPGEVVVTSAQFLIDSESKLREAAAKMLETSKQPAAEPALQGHRHD